MIRTGCLTVSTPNASGIYLTHNSIIIIYLSGRGRADGDTGRMMMTVHAWSGKVGDFRLGEGFSIRNLEELHPCNTPFLVRFICSDSHVVFRRTGDHACPATGAFIQINDHAVFMFAMLFFHQLPHPNPDRKTINQSTESAGAGNLSFRSF